MGEVGGGGRAEKEVCKRSKDVELKQMSHLFTHDVNVNTGLSTLE